MPIIILLKPAKIVKTSLTGTSTRRDLSQEFSYSFYF